VSLESIGHGSWRCEPPLAGFLVSRVVWAADGGLVVEDLERHNPIAKRLQITTDTRLALRFIACSTAPRTRQSISSVQRG
jgi:hypothetical protein